jgi:hypothetical protein
MPQQDLEEINKIAHMLNPNEEVFVVARQSRLKPGGSKFILPESISLRSSELHFWLCSD